MCAVHRTRRRAFEVNSFAVVAAAMAGGFEFVVAGFPIRSASQVRAACVNRTETIGSAIHPDAVFLLPFGINAQAVFRGIADLENGVRFKECARQEETEERY